MEVFKEERLNLVKVGESLFWKRLFQLFLKCSAMGLEATPYNPNLSGMLSQKDCLAKACLVYRVSFRP